MPVNKNNEINILPGFATLGTLGSSLNKVTASMFKFAFEVVF